ncbi:MAG: hypothetical protein ABI172_06460 [Ginsengibacter sp.]
MWQIFCVRDRLNPIMKRTIIIAFVLFAFPSCNNGKNNAYSSTSGPDTINNGNQGSVPVGTNGNTGSGTEGISGKAAKSDTINADISGKNHSNLSSRDSTYQK